MKQFYCCKICVIWTIAIFYFPLYAQEYKLEEINSESFPKIQLYLSGKKKRELSKEAISLLEKSGGETKEIEFIKIIQPFEKRSISVILSIGLSNWNKNQISKEIITKLLNEFSENSKFILQFYGDKTVFFSENLSKQEVRKKLEELESKNENFFTENLEYLYNHLSKSKPKLHIVIAPSEAKANDVTRVLAQRKDIYKIPLLMIGTDFLPYKVASSLSDGTFISINDPDLNFKVANYLTKFTEPLVTIEYETQFDEIFESFPSREIGVELFIGNKNFSTSYTITPLTIFFGWFSNVQVVLLFFGISLAFLILLTYAHYQKKRRLQWEEYLRKQEEIRKSDLYYHENVASYKEEKQGLKVLSSKEVSEEEWQKFEEEELELDLEPIEEDLGIDIASLPKGEAYEKAFFIQKEGPNPGRQFFVYKDEIIIGKDPKSDLVLLDPTVSPRHAKVKKINKTYYIFDLISERGILINGRKLLKPRPLYDFDEIRLGKVLLLFRGN